jgi:hypothetical protein
LLEQVLDPIDMDGIGSYPDNIGPKICKGGFQLFVQSQVKDFDLMFIENSGSNIFQRQRFIDKYIFSANCRERLRWF